MAELRDLPSTAGSPRFAEVFRDAFALFVGQGRRFSCEAVAAATKIPLRTVRAYQCGECLPSWERLWLLMLVLPTEFTDMLLAPAGLASVQRTDESPVAPRTMGRELADAMADLARCLERGQVDHRDAARLEPRVRALGGECARFANTLASDHNLHRGSRR